MERVNGYILGVSQLNEYVNNLLRRDGLLQGLQVRGEISGFKRHSSGHLYFGASCSGSMPFPCIPCQRMGKWSR